MSAVAHTPGRICDACEGFCLQGRVDAGIEMSLRIGQHVRNRDHLGARFTGRVRGLSIDIERVLQADIVLDAPIVIPARDAGDRDISIWHQHVPAHELTPFDERDELLAEALVALRDLVAHFDDHDGNNSEPGCPACDVVAAARSVIAKLTGSPA